MMSQLCRSVLIVLGALLVAFAAVAQASESRSFGTTSTTSPPVYRVDVVGDAVPTAINNRGQVVGWTGSPTTSAFVWTEGVGIQVLPHFGGGPSIAHDINDLGSVVGGSGGHAVRWVGGVVQDLGTLEPGGRSEATGINELGHVGGSASVGGQTHAFLFTDERGMVDVTPAADLRSVLGLNERDQLTGHRITFGNRAFRWTSGVLEDLGVPEGFAHSFGSAINDSGQVAGGASSATGNSTRLARFSDGVGWQILGGLGEGNRSFGINNQGTVVGEGVPVSGPVTAVVFFDGLGLFDLDELVPGTEWNLISAKDVNDGGQIAALAFNTVTGRFGALRLTPMPKMHVADVSVGLELRGRGGSGVATATIVDEGGGPVSGATVVGDWLLNGAVIQPGQTAITGADGRAQLRSDRIRRVRSGDTLTFCVTDVRHADFAYDARSNVETCGQAVVP